MFLKPFFGSVSLTTTLSGAQFQNSWPLERLLDWWRNGRRNWLGHDGMAAPHAVMICFCLTKCFRYYFCAVKKAWTWPAKGYSTFLYLVSPSLTKTAEAGIFPSVRNMALLFLCNWGSSNWFLYVLILTRKATTFFLSSIFRWRSRAILVFYGHQRDDSCWASWWSARLRSAPCVSMSWRFWDMQTFL